MREKYTPIVTHCRHILTNDRQHVQGRSRRINVELEDSYCLAMLLIAIVTSPCMAVLGVCGDAGVNRPTVCLSCESVAPTITYSTQHSIIIIIWINDYVMVRVFTILYLLSSL